MLNEQEETILARWLSGELTPEEREAFEKSEGFADYDHIIKGVDRFIKPPFDKEALRTKLFLVVDHPKKGNVISLRPWYYIAAASILILLALGLFFNQVNYKTLPGEQVTVSLPDGSLVRLNADSHLKRKRFFWSSDKKVTLVQGEGFFEVEKGDGFQVATKEGSIQVLGTKFNIKNRKDYFEVGCYQGKISFVEAKTNTKTVLTKGQEIIKIEERFSKDSLTNPTPAWMSGESLFKNTPLYIVLREMEVQYGISFEATGVAIDQRYTGGFIHGNLETALTTVLAPMGIAYTVGENQKTIRLSAAN